MPDPRPARANRPLRLAGALLVALAAAPGLAGAYSASDLYYQRAMMAAADARCRLFTPDLEAALAAAKAQARGAALRAGASPRTLQAEASDAAAAVARLPCDSPQVQSAAQVVRRAFDGYDRLTRMTFPGEIAAWRADRSLPALTPVWRLAQTAPLGRESATFGLAGDWRRPAVLLAMADFAPDAQPYAARLLVRDPTLAPEPYLDGAGRTLPLSARVPPRAAAQVFPAEARAAAGPGLAPTGDQSALAFRFPSAAVAALDALDPREAVTVEFQIQGPGGEVDRKAYFEVGDFAAGQAFLAATRR